MLFYDVLNDPPNLKNIKLTIIKVPLVAKFLWMYGRFFFLFYII